MSDRITAWEVAITRIAAFAVEKSFPEQETVDNSAGRG
jgi:hypothetical protein